MNPNDVIVFEPLVSAFSTSFWLALGISLLFLLGLLWTFSGKSDLKKYKAPVQMLLGFGMLLSLGTAYMLWLTSDQISPVHLTTDHISFRDNKIPYKRISGAYIHEEKSTSPLDPTLIRDTSYFMVLEEVGGRTHVFPKEHYNILDLVKEVRARME